MLNRDDANVSLQTTGFPAVHRLSAVDKYYRADGLCIRWAFLPSINESYEPNSKSAFRWPAGRVDAIWERFVNPNAPYSVSAFRMPKSQTGPNPTCQANEMLIASRQHWFLQWLLRQSDTRYYSYVLGEPIPFPTGDPSFLGLQHRKDIIKQRILMTVLAFQEDIQRS
jgi:hypothetical protein